MGHLKRIVIDSCDFFAFCILMIVIAFAVASCGEKKAEDPIEPVTPTDEDRALYLETQAHVLAHVHGGFGVVSKNADGSPEHLGEAGIWGGTFLWAATCDGGRAVSQAMASMIDRLDGQIVRVEPLGEYANGRQATLDTFLGVAAGVARRVVDCGEADLWSRPWFELVAFQAKNGDRLHAGTKSKVEGEFRYVRDLIAWKLGLRDKPDGSRRSEFQKTAAAWPGLTLLSHRTGVGSDACFRVNLAWTAIQASTLLGDELESGHRDTFCSDTSSMGLPHVDHYCGRESIDSYLASYAIDEWEYRLQRCSPPWESPDGHGNTSPRLDRLVALVVKHDWISLQR